MPLLKRILDENILLKSKLISLNLDNESTSDVEFKKGEVFVEESKDNQINLICEYLIEGRYLLTESFSSEDVKLPENSILDTSEYNITNRLFYQLDYYLECLREVLESIASLIRLYKKRSFYMHGLNDEKLGEITNFFKPLSYTEDYRLSVEGDFRCVNNLIMLSILDHDNRLNKDTLLFLLDIKKELDKTKARLKKCVAQRYEIKVNFLIRKYLLRWSNTNRKLSIYQFNAYEDLDESLFITDETNDFNDKIEYVYKLDIPKLDMAFQKTVTIDKAENFIDFHTLCKYYKDRNVSITKLENLVNRFESKTSTNETGLEIDKFARVTFGLYLQNNLLSLVIESSSHQGDKHHVQAEMILQDIETKMYENNYFNYFPYMKYCLLLIKFLELEQNNYFPNIPLAKQLLEKLIKYSTKMESSLMWRKRWVPFILQFPYSECICKVENKDLFIASSFILPFQFDTIEQDEIYPVNISVEKFKSLIDYHQITETDRKAMQDAVDKAKDAERKNIEILSVFSAIVMFSTGSIHAFEKMDPHTSLLFLQTFGTCLIGFVTLIYMTTRSGKIIQLLQSKIVKSNPFMYIFISVLILNVLLGYCLFATLLSWPPFTGNLKTNNSTVIETASYPLYVEDKFINTKDTTLNRDVRNKKLPSKRRQDSFPAHK